MMRKNLRDGRISDSSNLFYYKKSRNPLVQSKIQSVSKQVKSKYFLTLSKLNHFTEIFKRLTLLYVKCNNIMKTD